MNSNCQSDSSNDIHDDIFSSDGGFDDTAVIRECCNEKFAGTEDLPTEPSGASITPVVESNEVNATHSFDKSSVLHSDDDDTFFFTESMFQSTDDESDIKNFNIKKLKEIANLQQIQTRQSCSHVSETTVETKSDSSDAIDVLHNSSQYQHYTAVVQKWIDNPLNAVGKVCIL